jgi:hypothetical protein
MLKVGIGRVAIAIGALAIEPGFTFRRNSKCSV